MKEESAHDSIFLQTAIIWAWGCAYALERSMSEGRMPPWSFESRLALPVAVGLFGGLFYFLTMAVAINLTSSWFKGRASLKQIRRALILGAIPKALCVIFYLLLALVFRDAFFDDPELPDGRPLSDIVFFSASICVIAVLTVWSIIATSKALAEVQGFKSAWKAWLHYIVAFLSMVMVFAIPVVLLILAIKNP